MKTTNSIVAVVLVIVLGVGPVLTFARPEGARSSVLSSRRVRPIPKPRPTVPRSVQSPRLLEGQTSTMSPDGGLLIAGGMDQDGPRRSIEIFNSRTGKSKAVPEMARAGRITAPRYCRTVVFSKTGSRKDYYTVNCRSQLHRTQLTFSTKSSHRFPESLLGQ